MSPQSASSSSGSSSSVGVARSPAARRAAAAEDVHMMVECSRWIFAFMSLRLVRVVLDDEVRVVSAKKAADDPRRLPPLAFIAGKRWSAWDLGLMLGLPRERSAWVLFELSHMGQVVPLALRTGRCLAVAPIMRRATLPPGVFHRRRNAVSAAFIVDPAMRAASGLIHVGICLDPLKLWTPAELDLATATLVEVPGGG